MTDAQFISPNTLNLHIKLLSFTQNITPLLADHLRISITQAQLFGKQTAYILPMLIEKHLLTGAGDKLHSRANIIENTFDIKSLAKLNLRFFELSDDIANSLAQKTTVPIHQIQMGFDIMAQLYWYVIHSLFLMGNITHDDQLEFLQIQRLFWHDEQIQWANILQINSTKPIYSSNHYHLGQQHNPFQSSQLVLPNYAWLLNMAHHINQIPPLAIGHAIGCTVAPTLKPYQLWLNKIAQYRTILLVILSMALMMVLACLFAYKNFTHKNKPTATTQANVGISQDHAGISQDIAIIRIDDDLAEQSSAKITQDKQPKSKDKDKDKDKSKDKAKGTDKSKDTAKDTSKDKQKDKSKEQDKSKDKAKDKSKDTSKDSSQNKDKAKDADKSKDTSKDKDKSKDKSQDTSKDASKDKAKGTDKSKDTAKDTSKDKQKDKSKEQDKSKDKAKDTSKDSSQNKDKAKGTDKSKDTSKDTSKEQDKSIEKDESTDMSNSEKPTE